MMKTLVALFATATATASNEMCSAKFELSGTTGTTGMTQCASGKVVDSMASCASTSCDVATGSADVTTCCIDPPASTAATTTATTTAENNSSNRSANAVNVGCAGAFALTAALVVYA